MSTRIHIVIDRSEKARLEEAARRAGKSLSAFVREAAREKAEALRSPPLDSREALGAFFDEADAREHGREPDWKEHLEVMSGSRWSRALRARLCVFGFLWSVSVAACHSAEDGSQAPSVYVHRHVEASSMVPQGVSDSADLSLGGAGSDLFRVRGAFWLSDGSIVVANRGTNEIQVYDAHGSHLRSMGGHGEGPGEFSDVVSVSRLNGDSIAIWDTQQQRLTVLAANGSVASTVRFSNVESSVLLGGRRLTVLPSTVIVSPSGVPVARTNLLQSRWRLGSDGLLRDSLPLFIYDRAGQEVARIGPIAGTEHVIRGRNSFARPFGHRVYIAVSSQAIVVGSGKPATVRVFDFEGRLRHRLRFPVRRSPVTTREYQAWEERKAALFSPETADRRRSIWRSAPLPDTLPAYDALLVDGLDRLWVRMYPRAQDDDREWLVIDPDSLSARRVKVPRGAELLDARQGEVLLLLRDRLDVERVEVRRLR